MAKKAFDVVARNSLRGITDILSERFKGNAEVRAGHSSVQLELLELRGATQRFVVQVMKLRDELELKVDVLSLPVDICVQHALQGNSALQGALNVALKVLQDIEDYEAGLRQQEIDMVGLTHLHLCCLHSGGYNAPRMSGRHFVLGRFTNQTVWLQGTTEASMPMPPSCSPLLRALHRTCVAAHKTHLASFKSPSDAPAYRISLFSIHCIGKPT